MSYDPLERVREICRSLPETAEKTEFRPAFQVRHKTFAMFMDNHHGDGRVALWCKAPSGMQDALVRAAPERFFVPPYVGPKGWIGVRLDRKVDWDEVAGIIEDSYCMTAPKRVVAMLNRPADTGAEALPTPTGRGGHDERRLCD